jgi:NitT/TauT family transport system permease protein
MTRRAVILFWQLLILASLLVIWQWGFEWSKALLPRAYVPKILDPYFIAKPSAIWESFLKLGCLRKGDGFLACLGADENNLWFATLVTLKNTWWGFLFGSASGIAAGLILGRSDLLARIFGPYIVALNSIPRIAVVPLIILMFGSATCRKLRQPGSSCSSWCSSILSKALGRSTVTRSPLPVCSAPANGRS